MRFVLITCCCYGVLSEMKGWLYEGLSNEFWLGILLAKGVCAFKNSPHRCWVTYQMDLLWKELPGLLEPLHHHDKIFSSTLNLWSCSTLLRGWNKWKSQNDWLLLYGIWPITFKHTGCIISWTVQGHMMKPLVRMLSLHGAAKSVEDSTIPLYMNGYNPLY